MKNTQYRKSAFTLAEVLITLGIIGVVAAITIPALIANINSTRYKTHFKKTVALMAQAVELNESKYSYNWNEASVSCDNVTKIQNPEETPSKCAIITGNLAGTIAHGRLQNILDSKKNRYTKSITNAGTTPNFIDSYFASFTLLDGSIVAFHYGIADGNINNSQNSFCTKTDGTKIDEDFVKKHAFCIGFIDVNGLASPNKEVNCDDGNRFSENCTVSSNNVTDIYPIILLDNNVLPATAASKYVFSK